MLHHTTENNVGSTEWSLIQFRKAAMVALTLPADGVRRPNPFTLADAGYPGDLALAERRVNEARLLWAQVSKSGGNPDFMRQFLQ